MEHVYLDELVKLNEKIRVRKISEYKMQLAIASNPHSKEPKKLWDMLDNQVREPIDEKLDKTGMEKLKQQLLRNSRAIVVK